MFDRVVEAGGTALFSETTELIGAEHELAKRCVSEAVRTELLDLVASHEQAARSVGQDTRSINPGPANIEAGISTLEEKSLGAIHKAGSAPLQGVLEWAQRPAGKGLYFMHSSASSYKVVLPGMAGAGCNLVFFQFGGGGSRRRTLTGGEGIVAPQIWVTGNPRTALNIPDGIDFSAGGAITAGRSIAELGDELFELVLSIASGRLARTEMLRFFDPVQYHLPGPNF